MMAIYIILIACRFSDVPIVNRLLGHCTQAITRWTENYLRYILRPESSSDNFDNLFFGQVEYFDAFSICA